MPSYNQYKRQVAVLDADNSEIESWITVRGNHIPIKKGQSKEEAVHEFVKNKFENKEWHLENTKTGEKHYANKKTGHFEKEGSKKWSGWGMNKNKQVFSIKGGRVVVDPKLKTANWYNSQGALTLKQKDLDVDKFVEHGVNNLGWQKMSGKEESALKEFQKIANKPEYKGEKKPEAGFVPAPKGSKLRTKAEIEKSVNEYFEEYGVEEAKEWRKVKNNMWEHGVTHEAIEDIINSGKYNPDDILEALADRSHNKIDAMVKATKKKSEDGCDVKKRWSADWKKK